MVSGRFLTRKSPAQSAVSELSAPAAWSVESDQSDQTNDAAVVSPSVPAADEKTAVEEAVVCGLAMETLRLLVPLVAESANVPRSSYLRVAPAETVCAEVGRKWRRPLVRPPRESLPPTRLPVVVAKVPATCDAPLVMSQTATVVVAPKVTAAVFETVKATWPQSMSSATSAVTLKRPRTSLEPATRVVLGTVPAESVAIEPRTYIVPLPLVPLEATSFVARLVSTVPDESVELNPSSESRIAVIAEPDVAPEAVVGVST